MTCPGTGERFRSELISASVWKFRPSPVNHRARCQRLSDGIGIFPEPVLWIQKSPSRESSGKSRAMVSSLKEPWSSS